ncbi:retrovirus-related pol polyprotein from transposon TNT 1-94 [Tanacetum coccineum]
MQEELNQFVANDVWELVPKPRNMTIIGTKWVFRNKLDENGVVSQNKARLVAQGYNQQEDIDYDKTYALVARLESIMILLAYACALDFKQFQMEVKSAFLNGFINEEKDEECESVDSTKYRGMIGSLLYLTASRPDIMFSVCLCARFQEALKTSHLEAVKRIFRYIKGTTHLGLWYPKRTDIETVLYADSDHAGDYVDRKSISGICTFVGCCLTSWFSKKQTALAISTTEAEYVSTEKACQQALWMKQALIDYDPRSRDTPLVTLGQFAIKLARQKSNVDVKRKPLEFQVGDRAMLKKKVGPVAYKLELPQELSKVQNMFHVSNLEKCYSNDPLAVPLDGLDIEDKLYFVEEPVEIIDREVKRLKQSRIPIVKVRWNSRRGPEFTWEREDQIRKKYPHLFTKTAPSSSAAS